MNSNQPVKTTLGDRSKTGAVNAGVVAAMGGGMWGTELGIGKVFNRMFTGSWARDKTMMPAKYWLGIIGVTSAIAGVWSFATANKAKENKRQAYIDQAIDDARNPANHYTDKQQSEKIRAAVENAANGKIPDETVPNSTKFQEMVTTSRDQTLGAGKSV